MSEPAQFNLLELPPLLPEGFAYRPDLLAPQDEAALIGRFRELPFREFEFHGFFGKRRTVSFGLHYDFANAKPHRREELPDFLQPLRHRAAAFADLDPALIDHALVTEYTPGAAIGWHRDRPVFHDVVGVSLAAACRFRFRRLLGEARLPAGEARFGAGQRDWARAAITLAPRSAYLLRGPARTEWEHSIPPGEALRYSVTFRTLRGK
jgi:alkylated DNA repair dioxygenase AlkB